MLKERVDEKARRQQEEIERERAKW